MRIRVRMNIICNNNIRTLMSKHPNKKQRHSSLVDVPFTQRTAYFKQDVQADPYRTLPSRNALKNIIQNENIPFHNKYFTDNECSKALQEKLLSSCKMGRKNSLKKVANTCLKQISKNGMSLSDSEQLQRKIESIIESKLKKIIDNCIERNLLEILDDQKNYIKTLFLASEKEVHNRIEKVEKGYDNILQTYDNFLNIVEKIKDKSVKNQKYVRKPQFQNYIKQSQKQIMEIQRKMEGLTNELEGLKRVQRSFQMQDSKIKPILLNYESKQLGYEQLRVVVDTYNQNFMQIDLKLQQLYTYFT